jgi:hypothetical protein
MPCKAIAAAAGANTVATPAGVVDNAARLWVRAVAVLAEESILGVALAAWRAERFCKGNLGIVGKSDVVVLVAAGAIDLVV